MLAFFCVALRREVFESVGPLDERFGTGMFEDGDYVRRVRDAGWDVRCARDAFVHHWQKASFRRLGKDAYFSCSRRTGASTKRSGAASAPHERLNSRRAALLEPAPQRRRTSCRAPG